MDDMLRAWGVNIKERREALGMTQFDLATAIGVSWSTMSRWESGGAEPTRQNKALIAGALKTEVQALFPIASVA
jgi:transcriptional regulator with XRE-family HTH domain